MLLTLIIGRDANTGQLRLSTPDGKNTKLDGQPGSVGNDVSRKHLQLTVNDDRSCDIKDLNSANGTTVDDVPILVRNGIAWGSRVELGTSHYPINWTVIQQMLPRTVDITPLRGVWDKYKQQSIAIQKRQQRNNVLAGVPMLFTMGGGLLTPNLPSEFRWIGWIFTGIALVTMCVGLYLRATDKSIDQRERLGEWLQRHYTCPDCGHFMGNQPYDVLKQNKACPYCRTPYGTQQQQQQR